MKKFFLLLCFGFCSLTAFAADQVLEVKVTEKGFEPNSFKVKPGSVVSLKITRTTDTTCATAVVVPERKLKQQLPLNKPVTIKLGTLTKGEIHFTCAMKMLTGLVATE